MGKHLKIPLFQDVRGLCSQPQSCKKKIMLISKYKSNKDVFIKSIQKLIDINYLQKPAQDLREDTQMPPTISTNATA
jgi:hypothetical protein